MENRQNLTSGNLVGKLFVFATPIFAGNLLQAVYNLVDMIIVGQYLGSAGMSAVSIAGQVMHLVFSACNAYSNSGAAFVGQYFGAGMHEQVRKVVGTLLSSVILAAITIITVIFGFAHPLLRFLHTPAECYGETFAYLLIYTSGTVFVYVYTALTAALRGVGESLHPMIYIFITSLENILLDLLFVGALSWGTAGAAAATVISQATSMALVIRYTKRRTEIFDFKLRSFHIHMNILRPLFRLGLPQIIQHISTSTSFVLVTSLINRFGVVASAAAGAANKIWAFGIIPGRAINSALISLTAQCHPTKKYERVLRGLGAGVVFAVFMSSLLCILCQFVPGAIYGIFTSDTSILQVGVSYLRIFAFSFVVESIWFCIVGVLIGSGYTNVSMVCSLFSAFVIRLAFSWLLSTRTALGFNGIAVAYLIAPVFSVLLGGYYIFSGRWRKNRISVDA